VPEKNPLQTVSAAACVIEKKRTAAEATKTRDNVIIFENSFLGKRCSKKNAKVMQVWNIVPASESRLFANERKSRQLMPDARFFT
jgi:hypothetical protein